MAAGWWRNPWNFVRVLCGASGFVGAVVVLARLAYPQIDLSIALALPLALFTASFSASMGMWLYSHISQSARDAQFRFERIYQPVYDDLLQVIRALNDYRTAWLQKWRDIKDTSLNEFVAPEVTNGIGRLEEELENYSHVWNTAYVAVERILDSVRTGYPSRANPPNPGPEIANVIKSEYRFLFDPDTTSLPSSRMADIANRLGQAGYSDSRELAVEIIEKVKGEFLKSEEVRARLNSSKGLLPRVDEVRTIVHKRLMRPLS